MALTVRGRAMNDPERQARLLSSMSHAGFDALICNDATEVLLLTGYWPVMGASVAVLAADGECRVLLPEDEMELASQMTSATLVSYSPEEKSRLIDPMQALEGPLRSALDHLGLIQATIGVQLQRGIQPASYAASVQFRASLIELLRHIAPAGRYSSADSLLEQQKASKTLAELAAMRRAVAIAADGFAAAASSLTPGLREAEIAARIQAVFESSPAAEAVHRSYGFFYCMSGPNAAMAAAAYARTRQRRIVAGDLVMIHANTCADGFWTDLTRTYSIGPPLPKHQDMRAAIDEARSAALAAIKPGVAASQVDRAARAVMERHGLGEAFRHATGHGVGFAAANADALPRIHPASADILEEGMTFNVEPAAYFDDYGGMRHCDVVAVTNNGAAVLSDW